MSFDQPRWFDLPNWRMTLTALYDNTRDVNTFSSNRLEGSIQLTQRATKATQLLYRFSYRRIQVDPNSFPAGFSPDLIPIYSQPVRVGMPSLTYLRDTRDDPVNSTKGTYNTFDIGAASSFFGSRGGLWEIAGAERHLHEVSQELGARPLAAHRGGESIRQPGIYSAAGALLCGRVEFASWLCHQSGGTARSVLRCAAGR